MNSESLKKDTILLFIKVPPPVTGATIMNKRVKDNKLLQDEFCIRTLCVSYMKKLNEMGKWKFSKIKVFLKTIKELCLELYFYDPLFVYFQLSPYGLSFYRDLFYIILIKLFRKKIAYHLHVSPEKISQEKGFKKIIYNFCFNNQYVICLSELLLFDIDKIFNLKAFIVPNGIPDNKEWAISKTDEHGYLKLLFLSNLMKSKGIFDFLKALTILKRKGIDFRAKIIGEDYDVNKNELEMRINEEGLGELVNCLGGVYGREKFSLISSSDVLIYPTHNDAFPIVILETLSVGTCIIASKIGAIPEIIDDGVDGFLIEKKSPFQIADKIKNINEEKSMLARISTEGRKKYLYKYNINVFEKNILNVFKRISLDIK